MKVKRKIRRQEAAPFEPKAIGQRMRQIRGFDMTQADFAHQLGVSQSQLSKYERGLVAPSADVLIRIKEQFGKSIDWLLTGKD